MTEEAEVEKLRHEIDSLVTIWVWIKHFGGTLNESRAHLNLRRDRRRGKVFSASTHGDDWLKAAADWAREGGKE